MTYVRLTENKWPIALYTCSIQTLIRTRTVYIVLKVNDGENPPIVMSMWEFPLRDVGVMRDVRLTN